MRLKLPVAAALAVCLLMSADKYDGPRPPKPDIPYLVHANHLVETEIGEARENSGKKDTTYMIPGAASPAKTPLAEPVFIVDAKTLAPDQIELYRLEVKNGQREVVMTQKRRHSPAGPFHLMVTRLGDRLYKIEVDEPLENGQYSLSPNGSNRVFCFEIY
jgi:hypothetical protein